MVQKCLFYSLLFSILFLVLAPFVSRANAQSPSPNASILLSVSEATSGATPDTALCDDQGVCSNDIGPIPLDPGALVNQILQYSVVLGGALALILVIWGGFTISTSHGNPNDVRKGKDIITYALVGLGLILVSVLLVNAIGGGIIGIPTFGTSN